VDRTEEQKDTTQVQPGQPSGLQGKPEETSGAKPQETSQKPPETYTREQLEKFRSDALMEQGRKHKAEVDALRRERDELASIKDDREALQKQLDELSSKDPEVFSLAKKERELREREKQLAKELREHSERIKKADNYERDVSITKIVEEYEGGDFDKLKGLCETFSAYSEEQIRKAAETLWSKKFIPPVTETPPVPPVKPYSGMTSGNRKDYSGLSARQKIEEGLKQRLNL